MTKSILGIICFIFISIVFLGTSDSEKFEISQDKTVDEILTILGYDNNPNQAHKGLADASKEAGKRMVLDGFSFDASGRRHPKLGNHFVCTSCHNVVKEVEDLTDIDPQSRLDYAVKNDLPFVQGSSLYGIVNRTTFYNGDYVKKYGDLAGKAHKNIREAIQLCAIECAQGRRLKNWEIESILLYLWELQLRVEDLNLSTSEMDQIQAALDKNSNVTEAIALIKSKFRSDSPATFGKPPGDLKKGFELKGNAENGKLIYEYGCQHCHKGQRYSFLELDDSNLSFKYLRKHLKRHNRFSFYWVSRYGTQPRPGKKAYMPQYTMEKMSDQQLEDLRAYIDQRAD